MKMDETTNMNATASSSKRVRNNLLIVEGRDEIDIATISAPGTTEQAFPDNEGSRAILPGDVSPKDTLPSAEPAVSSVSYDSPVSVAPIPERPIVEEKRDMKTMNGIDRTDSANVVNEPFVGDYKHNGQHEGQIQAYPQPGQTQVQLQGQAQNQSGNTSTNANSGTNANTGTGTGTGMDGQTQQVVIETGCCVCLTTWCCCCKQSCDCCSSTCICCKESLGCCKEVCISCCECNKEFVGGSCVLCERCLMCCGETSWDLTRKTSDTFAFSCLCLPIIIVNSFTCLIEGLKGECACMGEFLGHSGLCIKGSASEAFTCCVKSSRACCPTCCSCGEVRMDVKNTKTDTKTEAGKEE